MQRGEIVSSSKGKFIVIDGIDGSGKATQAEILRESLVKEGYDVEIFDFPQYGERSAALVEMYLNGEFGTADEVGPHIGSIFYAVDRYAASNKIKQAIDNGKIVISNRYVSASKGHQTSKIESKKDRAKFINWLNELEYDLFNIPIPDLTIFLHVPAEVGYKLVLEKKEREYIKGKKQDIHEADKTHLFKAEKAYLDLIYGGDSYENWVKISCASGNEILPIDEIAKKILTIVNNDLLTNLPGINHLSKQEEGNISEKINFLHALITDAYDSFMNNEDNLEQIAKKIDSNLLSLSNYLNVSYIKTECESCALSIDKSFARLHRVVSLIYENYKVGEFGILAKNLTEASMILSQFICKKEVLT